ncbi:MAG TPA: DUF4163 domain-containing protein [Novosphingobium sp.]|nr:DUF4163 domain-containing protein [Novosphingobium sp.]
MAVKEETELYSLDYAWPAEAGAIPALAAVLEARLAETRAGLLRDAREAKEAAEADGYPYRPFGSWTEWKLAGETPGWLSLSGLASVYTGGAHPMHGYTALLWDKAESRNSGRFLRPAGSPARGKARAAGACGQHRRVRHMHRSHGLPPGSGIDCRAGLRSPAGAGAAL